MNTQVYLVSPNFIRTVTNVSSNLQDKFLESAIREACDVDYQETVGTSLYNALKEKIADNTILNIENIHYKELLDISKYFLAYTVIARVSVIASVKIDNIGANQTSDEKVQPLNLKDVFTVENYYYNKADFYKKRLQEYLYNNKEYLKEIDSCVCNSLHSNLYSAAKTHIFLGGYRGKKLHY